MSKELDLLELLTPSRGSLQGIQKYSSAFYARLDTLNQMKINKADAQGLRKEQAMLRQVLEWNKLKTYIDENL